MACYQCGAHEGGEAQLCKACQERRLTEYQTIREKLASNGDRWSQYWAIVREEWYLGVALIVLLFFSLYLVISFLRRPYESKIAQLKQESGSGEAPGPPGSAPGNAGESPGDESLPPPPYTATEVYESCMVALQRVDPSTLDADAVIEAHKEAYKKELEELDKENPKDDKGEPLTLFAKVLLVRARESCQLAKTSCETNIRSQDCERFAREYVKPDSMEAR